MKQFEQYTADAICQSMGIGPFIDPSWCRDVRVIRLLLKPSFDPEVCLTITEAGGVVSLTTSVLAEMLWRQDYPCRLPTYNDHTELSLAQFTCLAHHHHQAMTDSAAQRSVCIDGIGMHCVWTTAHGYDQLQSHIVRKALRTFVAAMIDQAWLASTNLYLRNGLAECARYIGVEYPLDPIPPKPTQIRLAVFGAPDEVKDYFRMFKPL